MAMINFIHCSMYCMKFACVVAKMKKEHFVAYMFFYMALYHIVPLEFFEPIVLIQWGLDRSLLGEYDQ